MKKIITLVVCSCLTGGIVSKGYAENDATKQVQLLNSQIQAQFQQIQASQQAQIKTLNDQIQTQIKQMQTELQAQIQKVNTTAQEQIKLVQTTLQQQIQQVQKEAAHIPQANKS